MDTGLLLAVLAGITVLLLLILAVRLHAFISLLIASIVTGILAGQDGAQIADTMQRGMGGTLGFVATIIGLGAMLGAMLEASGGAQAIASALIARTGIRRAPVAMLVAGFVIAIPVFFDVALIILMPVIYGLQRKSGASLLAFAIPLLAGLAVAHAFVPPTPGPVAVAEIIGAKLGMVIIVGLLAGIPAALAGGLIWGRYLSRQIHINAPDADDSSALQSLPSAGLLVALICLPLALIIANTMVSMSPGETPNVMRAILSVIGHPFGALILANLLAWYALGIRRGMDRDTLLKISARSFAPAGAIILLTGAGGVFKQMLVDTGSGEMLATALSQSGVPVIVFAFIAAALVRILQGSATVAMITAAGLTAPFVTAAGLGAWQAACIVVAISSGATFLSHVNDSGFWLVKQYLGLSERQTFRAWTVMTMILGLAGFLSVTCIYLLI